MRARSPSAYLLYYPWLVGGTNQSVAARTKRGANVEIDEAARMRRGKRWELVDYFIILLYTDHGSFEAVLSNSSEVSEGKERIVS